MTGRSVPLWRGKTPDAKVPPRVRQRVLERFDSTCYLSGIKIASGMAWELEHVKALALGGSHSEDNLAPALTEYHKIKTAAEMKAKAKADRVAKKASGSKPAPARKIESPDFPQSGRRKAHPMPMPARRNILTGERY